MNEIQLFTNELFGSVRTTIDQIGNPWFIGADVAKALGYSNTRDALVKHVLDEDKGVVNCDTPGGKQNMVIINESGLYSLIFSSKLPSAIEFKHWVTSEVLPTMRKIGFNRSMQVLSQENQQLKEINDGLAGNNFLSGVRAAGQADMRAQMIEKLRSIPDGTVLNPELKQFIIQYDENWGN